MQTLQFPPAFVLESSPPCRQTVDGIIRFLVARPHHRVVRARPTHGTTLCRVVQPKKNVHTVENAILIEQATLLNNTRWRTSGSLPDIVSREGSADGVSSLPSSGGSIITWSIRSNLRCKSTSSPGRNCKVGIMQNRRPYMVGGVMCEVLLPEDMQETRGGA